ncbi:MAG: 50S ribosomal protein L21 [Sodalinema sp.]|uniref:50S ribosomal protein L21 n=1 Tax=Sodalinema sp. TaxID=3080550 RepID=UPI00396F35B1
MTYAIIETSGTQIMVEPGRFYDVNLLDAAPGDEITIDKVLFIRNEDDAHVGQPWVEGATVRGTVLQHLRGRKVIVYKMQPKKKTRKKRGHRQELTRFAISSISVNGTVLAEAEIPAPRGLDLEPATTDEPAEVAEMVSAEAE